MGFTIRNLNAGTLPLFSETVANRIIFAGSSTKSTLVKSISLTNKDTVARYCTLYARINSVEYPITPIEIYIPAGGMALFENDITLAITNSQNDQLTAKAEVTNMIAFVINGIEREA
jgi:hypothetical protein